MPPRESSASRGRSGCGPDLRRCPRAGAATGTWPRGFARRVGFEGAYGCCDQQSLGKDTPSGHWEMAGVPVLFEWGYFTAPTETFPPELLDQLIERADLPGLPRPRLLAPENLLLTIFGQY